jgi:hypothetical protein
LLISAWEPALEVRWKRSGRWPGDPAAPALSKLEDCRGPSALASGTALLILDRRAGHSSDQAAARYIERFSPNTVTAVLVGIAGITFLLKAGGGLYWLIPAAVASLVGGVVNAWLFLVKVNSYKGRRPGYLMMRPPSGHST